MTAHLPSLSGAPEVALRFAGRGMQFFSRVRVAGSKAMEAGSCELTCFGRRRGRSGSVVGQKYFNDFSAWQAVATASTELRRMCGVSASEGAADAQWGRDRSKAFQWPLDMASRGDGLDESRWVCRLRREPWTLRGSVTARVHIHVHTRYRGHPWPLPRSP